MASTMKIAIHQPEYWPIPRLLAKWRAADLLIMLDNVDFDRESYQHRAKVRYQAGGKSLNFLTIPFRHAGEPQQIRVLEPATPDWAQAHWDCIKNWYRDSAPADRLREVGYWFRRVAEHEDSIGNYAWASMVWLGAQAHIDTPVVPASALIGPDGGWGYKDTRVLRLCQAVRAKTYLSGKSGAAYIDFAEFERVGISVEVQSYSQPTEELSGLHEYLTEGPEHLAYLTRRP